jgi:hypothetical protein
MDQLHMRKRWKSEQKLLKSWKIADKNEIMFIIKKVIAINNNLYIRKCK